MVGENEPMQIYYKPEAIRRLKRLGTVEKQKVRRKIINLPINPYIGKKLKGEFAGLRSLKAWPFRVIYSFDQKSQTIIIITVDYRGEVYK